MRASAEENADLFWGLRGGGGNFGVVTGIDYALHPVGPEVVGGVVAWPASEAPRVLELYRTLADEAPPRTDARRADAPGAAGAVAAEGHARQADRRAAGLPQRHARGRREGRRAHQVVRQADRRRAGAAARTRRCSPCSTPRSRRAGATTGRASTCPRIEPALCEKVIEHAAKIRSPHSAVILFQMDGALNSLDDDAFPRRQPRCALRAQHHGRMGPGRRRRGEHRVGAPGVERHEGVLDRRQLHQLPDRGRESRTHRGRARRRDCTRLAQIKAKWDPKNVFRTNRNVAPV